MKTTICLILGSLFFGNLVKAQGAPAAEEKPQVTIEEYLQKLSTIPNVMGRKDPFIQVAPPFQAPVRVIGATEEAPDPRIPALQRYPIQQYSVVATLVEENHSRALVRLPGQAGGKVVIIRDKEKFGNKAGYVKNISTEGITVVQKQRTPLGFIDNQEILLAVGAGPGVGGEAAGGRKK